MQWDLERGGVRLSASTSLVVEKLGGRGWDKLVFSLFSQVGECWWGSFDISVNYFTVFTLGEGVGSPCQRIHTISIRAVCCKDCLQYSYFVHQRIPFFDFFEPLKNSGQV